LHFESMFPLLHHSNSARLLSQSGAIARAGVNELFLNSRG
jgi:hypothetical protein